MFIRKLFVQRSVSSLSNSIQFFYWYESHISVISHLGSKSQNLILVLLNYFRTNLLENCFLLCNCQSLLYLSRVIYPSISHLTWFFLLVFLLRICLISSQDSSKSLQGITTVLLAEFSCQKFISALINFLPAVAFLAPK